MGLRVLVVGIVAAIATTAHARATELAPHAVTEPAALTRALPGPCPALDDIARSGRSWRLETERGAVRVWVPAGYNAATAATIVFVHGYRTDVDDIWNDYHLPEQFALSGINAMFIAPEAPAGKHARLTWPSLEDLVATVELGVDATMPAGRLVVVGHSGAYRMLATWLHDKRLDSVVLLDAVYGEYSFAPWVRKSPSHRLVNIAEETQRYSDYLHRRLPMTTKLLGMPTDRLPDARVVYVKTDIGHWHLVSDGVVLPMALRSLGLGYAFAAPLELPFGLAQHVESGGTASVSTIQ